MNITKDTRRNIMKKQLVCIGAVILLLVSTLALPGLAQLTPELPRHETLIAGMLTGRVGSATNFNDWVGWKWRDRGMMNLANEPLWSVDFVTGEIINGLAVGDPIYSKDFLHMTIPLREGVTWSDGVPFTADDVVYTVKTIMATPGFNDHAVLTDYVDDVYKDGDYKVIFDLKKSNSRFHRKFIDKWGCIWIMPKHIFETAADPLTFEFDPFVGCGPYKLHSYDPSGYWTIWEKRTDWDKSPTGILYGEPKPRYIVFQAFGTEGAKIVAQLTHQLDAVDLSAEGLKAALSQGKTIRAYQQGFPWVVNNDPCITGITFNTAVAPFDNVDVRWALILAIDIVEYVGQAVDAMAPLSPILIPPVSPHFKVYIKPMEPWLEAFTLDLGGGETFQPYDADAPERVIEYARNRGYIISDDPAVQEQAFGLGWYKYAPEVAAKLLEKNGFSKNSDGQWLLPDDTVWKIEVLGGTDTSHLTFKNAHAAIQQWKQFGIDAQYIASDANATLIGNGEFQVSGNWPAEGSFSGGDLYRVFDSYNSAYVRPLGTQTTGRNYSRWSSPEMDAVINALKATDPGDTAATVALGIEGLKLAVKEMFGFPTFGYIGFVTWDEYYWTNWPGSENPYTQPYVHWAPFKYMTPFLEPTGNK